jgi:OHCU decarboxylase
LNLAAASVERLDALPPDAAERELLACCGSREWARQMALARPFREPAVLYQAADRIWRSLSESDWREALAAHRRIGDVAASGDAAEEQSGALSAPASIRESLARSNAEYEARFGHMFVVCASGRSGEEMLALCRDRLHNDPKAELRLAAQEQRKIMRLRLERLARTE